MNTSFFFAVVCAASSAACNLECMGECEDWDDECSEHQKGGAGQAAGSSGSPDASGGRGATGNELGGAPNSGNVGGTANSGGKPGGSKPVPASCSEERDCERGFNCDSQRRECVEAAAETCSELSTETDCDNRNDCKSIYAGTNCSCGPECSCIGGEPGCVCESFSFFTCEPLES